MITLAILLTALALGCIRFFYRASIEITFRLAVICFAIITVLCIIGGCFIGTLGFFMLF